MSKTTPCAACGVRIHGPVEYSVHEDIGCEGEEVPLCFGCGGRERPSHADLVIAIGARRSKEGTDAKG